MIREAEDDGYYTAEELNLHAFFLAILESNAIRLLHVYRVQVTKMRESAAKKCSPLELHSLRE